MRFYSSYSRVPELAGLTRKQRKLVYRCALEAFFSDQPSSIWVCTAVVGGSVLVGALAGWVVVACTGLAGPAWWQTKWFIVALSGLTAALIGNFVGQHWITARLRPYLRRVLEKRGLEIAQIK
jgi:hypothetical protein